MAEQYRALPTLIEAIQWLNGEPNNAELEEWTNRAFRVEYGRVPRLWVQANQAWLDIEYGEWIAKDSKGFYPIKADVFAEKYRLASEEPPFSIDAKHLARQRDFSQETFGPGRRLFGVLDHIRKELVEVEADPQDMTEWADLVILAFDGALRQGHEPQQLLDVILGKQTTNEGRTWPDWRTADPDKAIEHVRVEEAPKPETCKHCGHEIVRGSNVGGWYHPMEHGVGGGLGRCQQDVTRYGYNAEPIGTPCDVPCLGSREPDPNERKLDGKH